MRRIDPDLSTVDFDATSVLNTVLTGFEDRTTINFFYIKGGSSDSLIFFRIFDNVDGLSLFRVLLASLSPDHDRLLILFTSSLLRFRFCCVIHDACPLCKI